VKVIRNCLFFFDENWIDREENEKKENEKKERKKKKKRRKRRKKTPKPIELKNETVYRESSQTEKQQVIKQMRFLSTKALNARSGFLRVVVEHCFETVAECHDIWEWSVPELEGMGDDFDGPASYAGIGAGLIEQVKVAWTLGVKAKAIH
jgi:hypothetical protein